MNSYYIHRLIKLVSPLNEEVFTIEFGGKEDELKDLIATILNINPSSIKGIRDCYGNYHTISSALKNNQLTMEYSSFYYIVLNLKNHSPHNTIKFDKNLFHNFNFDLYSPNRRKEEFNNFYNFNNNSFNNNTNDPYEILAFRLFNEKFIDKSKYNVLKNLINERNEEIITLFKLYFNHGKDINKLSTQIFPILNYYLNNNFNNSIFNNLNLNNLGKNDEIEIHSMKNFQNPLFNNANNNLKLLENIDNILKLSQSDFELLRKLILCDNEQIIKAFEEYSLTNNLNKLKISLDFIIQNYGIRFTEPNIDSKKNTISKQYKLIKKSEKIKNKIYKTFSSDNTFLQDCILLFKADMENMETKEKINLFKQLNIKESSFPLNSELKKSIIDYYNDKLKNKFFKNFNEDELKIYEELIKKNDENIINAYKKYIKNKNSDELSSEIRKWILKIIEENQNEIKIKEDEYISSSSSFDEEEEEEEEESSSSSSIINNNNNNKFNKSNKHFSNQESEEFIINKKTNPLLLLNNNYKLNAKRQQTQDNNNNEKPKLTLLSIRKAEEISKNNNTNDYIHNNFPNLNISDRKLTEFIKIISNISITEKEKKQILNLLNDKNQNIMKVYERFQKNKLSLTKTILLNTIKNNINNNIKNNNEYETNKKSTFDKFLQKLESEKKINKDSSSFLLSEYNDGNKMLRSFWEVFKNGKDDEEGLLENIEIFLTKYGGKIKLNISDNEDKKRSLKDNEGKTPISIKSFKKDMVNYLKITEKKDTKLKQKKIIDLLIKENFINPQSQEFFYDKISCEDKLFIAACEVFSITLNHLDFSETLNILYELSKKNNNNEKKDKDDYLSLLNYILDKGNFSDNEKKITIEEYNKKNNVLMSILEVYDKDDEEDTIDSLKALIAKLIHSKLL